MTDRTRGPHTSGSPQEAIDLNELHASKTQEALRTEVLEPSNTDLSSASIQSISVVRLSARPEKRKHAGPLRPTSTEGELQKEANASKKPLQGKGQPHGLLKNPYFPYQGNLLERFVTFIANFLKVAELSILKSLRPTPPPAPPRVVIAKPKRRGPDGRELEEDEGEPVVEKEVDPLVLRRE